MKVTYNPAMYVLRIDFDGNAIEESDEISPGVVLDYDLDGNVMAMEILDASTRMENPRVMEYAVAE